MRPLAQVVLAATTVLLSSLTLFPWLEAKLGLEQGAIFSLLLTAMFLGAVYVYIRLKRSD